MSSTVTVRPTRGVRGIGLFAIIAGIVMIVAGILVWILVATQLSNEKITVSGDAPLLGGMFQGRRVMDPFTAFAQADAIDHHALAASGGKTYAELAQDDPLRNTVMTASFLRASLFTSVVAFGICVLVVALGILFLFVGSALRRLADGPEISVTDASVAPLSSSGEGYGRHTTGGTVADERQAQPPADTTRYEADRPQGAPDTRYDAQPPQAAPDTRYDTDRPQADPGDTTGRDTQA